MVTSIEQESNLFILDFVIIYQHLQPKIRRWAKIDALPIHRW